MKTYNLLLIGCGNMGKALLGGWQSAGLLKQCVVVEPHRNPSPSWERASLPQEGAGEGVPFSYPHPITDANASAIDLSHEGEVMYVTDTSQIPPAFSPAMIVLAVKPQSLTEVLPAYRHYAPHVPFLSIAAGKTLAWFARQLGDDAALIRTMPNLAATVGRSVTACTASNAATQAHKDMATTLMQAVGSVHWVDESQLDAVTALSGSGPAYVFLLAEIMAQAGESLGLNHDMAAALARETVIGAAELLRQSPESAATLRGQVTSKGGTTEAALRILMKDDAVLGIVRLALQAAAIRAHELAD